MLQLIPHISLCVGIHGQRLDGCAIVRELCMDKYSVCRSLLVQTCTVDGKDYLGCFLGCAGVPPKDEVTWETVIWSENRLKSISQRVNAYWLMLGSILHSRIQDCQH